MARVFLLSLLYFAILLISEARTGPEASPAPAPHSGADGPSHFFPQATPPSMPAPASSPSPDSDSANPSSPPSPPPPEDSPSSSSSPSPSHPSLNEEETAVSSGSGVPEKTSSTGGGKPGRVAGTIVGVVIGAAVVTVAFIIYKKRRDNIRRSQYGFGARREML
ncbi:unnamed protein product [Victoria cruziana]